MYALAKILSQNAPNELKLYRQFLVWKRVFLPGETKPRNIPYELNTDSAASISDLGKWEELCAKESL